MQDQTIKFEITSTVDRIELLIAWMNSIHFATMLVQLGGQNRWLVLTECVKEDGGGYRFLLTGRMYFTKPTGKIQPEFRNFGGYYDTKTGKGWIATN
jgi:hypothetical protein